MYDPKLTEANRVKLEAELSLELPYWTYQDVQQWGIRLRDAFDIDGNQLRVLAEEEQHFITSCRLLAQIDFRFFLTRFCLILTEQKKLEPIIPWPSQEKLLRVLGEEEARQAPYGSCKIPVVLLKSRQVGGTVIGEAIVAHMVFLNPNTQGLIASDHPATSLNTLFYTLTRVYDNMPRWFRPAIDGRVKGGHLHFNELDSDVLVGAGNQKNTLGQGMTLDVVHLTELSTWEFPSSIDEDLLPAFNSSMKHHTVALLESTGAGAKGNWFYEHFMAAWNKKTSWRAVFAAWYLRPSYRLRSEGVEFAPHTRDMAKRVKQETGQELDKEQLAYYQFTRRDLEQKGELEKFYQEYPSTVEEAFQTGVKAAFPLELRSKMRDKVKLPLVVAEVNLAKQKLVKVELDGYIKSEDPTKWKDRLVIWEMPKKGKLYVVSVDASHGLDEDNAAVEVVRVGDKNSPDEQVAEWCGDLPPGDLAIVAGVVGRIFRDKDADLDALLAVEANPGSPGTTTLLVLEQMGYTNLYISQVAHGTLGQTRQVYGWWTTAATRPLITNVLVEYLKKEQVQINSPELIGEMGSFVKKQTPGGTIRLEAFAGYHDDRLMALGIGLYIAHEDDIVVMADERRRSEETRLKLQTPTKKVQFWQLAGRQKVGEDWDAFIAGTLDTGN